MTFDRNVHFHSFMFSIQSILKQAPLFSCSFPPPWVHLLTFLKCLFIVILCAKYLSKPFENTGKIKYIFLKYNNVWYMFFVCSFALCFFFLVLKKTIECHCILCIYFSTIYSHIHAETYAIILLQYISWIGSIKVATTYDRIVRAYFIILHLLWEVLKQ